MWWKSLYPWNQQTRTLETSRDRGTNITGCIMSVDKNRTPLELQWPGPGTWFIPHITAVVVTTLAWSADSEMWSVTIVATTTMELDTGASRSIINTKNFGNRIHPPSNVPPSISRPVGAQQPASPVYPVGDQG